MCWQETQLKPEQVRPSAPMTQNQLLADRATGLGGSDIHHVFSLPPYGCARRLWYEKRGIEPDHPQTETAAMTRGKRLEPIAAEEYVRATGRRLEERGVQRDPEHPELLVHVDREIFDRHRDEGTLEIKCPGREMFFKVKREGMPDAYLLQEQHALGITGQQWGAFAVFNADLWQLLHWDVERDDAIIPDIRAAGISFWRQVKEGPEPARLEPTDRRCGSCPWRTSCQGAALLEACKDASGEGSADVQFLPIGSLVDQYFEAAEVAREADDWLECCKEALRAELGERGAADAPGARIYYRPQTSMRWDTKALEKKHPELAKEFKRPSVSRPLRVYPR